MGKLCATRHVTRDYDIIMYIDRSILTPYWLVSSVYLPNLHFDIDFAVESAFANCSKRPGVRFGLGWGLNTCSGARPGINGWDHHNVAGIVK